MVIIMKWQKVNVIYEFLMILLVTLSLMSIMMKNELPYLHTMIWLIFVIDVSIRFIRAATKWRYVKNNSFDILSVIPLEDMFILARFARFLRLFRYKNIIKRYLDKIDILLARINFVRLTIVIMLANVLISMLLTAFKIFDFTYSLEWTFFNFFKFNYISDTNTLIILSAVLKISGVLYLGILLKKLLNAAKFYYDKYRQKREKAKS